MALALPAPTPLELRPGLVNALLKNRVIESNRMAIMEIEYMYWILKQECCGLLLLLQYEVVWHVLKSQCDAFAFHCVTKLLFARIWDSIIPQIHRVQRPIEL